MNHNKKIDSNQIIKGLSWTTLSTIFNGISQILRLAILTRFLQKEDFGIVAILIFILGLTQVFSDMGFSAAIMSEKNLSRTRFIGLYWLQFIIFNALAIIVSISSPFIATYYNEYSLTWLVPIMLSELFFISLGKLYDTVLQKTMQFKLICIRNMVAIIISLVLAIILAVLNCGVYSLVLSTIAQSAIVNIWNLIAGQREYQLKFSKIYFKELSDLLRVGGFQMGTQIIDYIASKLDIFIISTYLGIGAVGIYSLAKELVIKIVTIVNTVVSKVMLPVLAKYQDDISMLRQTFVGFISRLAKLNIPLTGFVFLFASPIINILYGSGYSEATPIVRIMSIWSLFVIMSSPNGLLSLVRKHTDVLFVYTITRVIIMGILLFIFARHSLYAAAITMNVAYFIMFFVSWKLQIFNEINLSLASYLKLFVKTVVVVGLVTICMYVSFQLLKQVNIQMYILMSLLYFGIIIVYLLFVDDGIKRLLVKLLNKF